MFFRSIVMCVQCVWISILPVTYTHQREQKGLAHALLTAEDHVDDDFMLLLGDNIFQGNLEDVLPDIGCSELMRRFSSRKCRGRSFSVRCL